jgi:hypothetical protein
MGYRGTTALVRLYHGLPGHNCTGTAIPWLTGAQLHWHGYTMAYQGITALVRLYHGLPGHNCTGTAIPWHNCTGTAIPWHNCTGTAIPWLTGAQLHSREWRQTHWFWKTNWHMKSFITKTYIPYAEIHFYSSEKKGWNFEMPKKSRLYYPQSLYDGGHSSITLDISTHVLYSDIINSNSWELAFGDETSII